MAGCGEKIKLPTPCFHANWAETVCILHSYTSFFSYTHPYIVIESAYHGTAHVRLSYPTLTYNFVNLSRPTNTINVYVSNLAPSGTIPAGWTFTMYNPAYLSQSGFWNMQV